MSSTLHLTLYDAFKVSLLNIKLSGQTVWKVNNKRTFLKIFTFGLFRSTFFVDHHLMLKETLKWLWLSILWDQFSPAQHNDMLSSFASCHIERVANAYLTGGLHQNISILAHFGPGSDHRSRRVDALVRMKCWLKWSHFGGWVEMIAVCHRRYTCYVMTW